MFWIPAPRRVTVYTSRSIAPRIVGTMGMRRFSFAVARLLLGCARADRRPKHGRSCRRSSRGSSFNRSRIVNLNSKCSKHEAARPHARTTAAMADHGAGKLKNYVIRRYTDKQRVNCSTQYLWLQRLITLVSDRNTEGLR